MGLGSGLRLERLAHPTQEERHQPRRTLAQISTQAAGRAGDQRLLAVVGGGSVRVVGVGPVRVQTWLGLGMRVLGAMPNAQCNAQCPTPICPMLNCPMPNAQCPYAQCSIAQCQFLGSGSGLTRVHPEDAGADGVPTLSRTREILDDGPQ